MIYRLIPYALMFIARKLTKSQKAKRTMQNAARRTARKGR